MYIKEKKSMARKQPENENKIFDSNGKQRTAHYQIHIYALDQQTRRQLQNSTHIHTEKRFTEKLTQYD